MGAGLCGLKSALRQGVDDRCGNKIIRTTMLSQVAKGTVAHAIANADIEKGAAQPLPFRP